MDNEVFGTPNLLIRCSGCLCFSKSIFLSNLRIWTFTPMLLLHCPHLCLSPSLQVGFVGCLIRMQHFLCVTATVWVPWISMWRAILLKATVQSGVTLTCISLPQSILRWLQFYRVWPTFKPGWFCPSSSCIWGQREVKASEIQVWFPEYHTQTPSKIQSCLTLVSAPWLPLHIPPKHRLQPWLSQQRRKESSLY